MVTYGYPAGGEQISYTRGVVSRIEIQSYSHIGNRAYLAAQTDAAINPGNSGGPVIQDDKVVGVAFQGIPGLENAGFFITTTLVKHFLQDIEDKTYDGFPQAGVRIVALQNPAYRRLLKLPDNDIGARIDHIFDVPTSREMLRVDDVLLRIGDYVVGSDGTIVYRDNRVFLSAAFSDYQHGEKVPLKLWREGKEIDVSLPVYTYVKDKPEGSQYDVLPRYFVYGGLVFVPLTRDYLRSDKIGLVCERMPYGVRKEYETFLRAVLQSNPHSEIQGLACLSLAKFLNARRLKLDLLKDRPELATRYEGLFGKEYLEELQAQDRAKAGEEAELRVSAPLRDDQQRRSA